MTAERAPHGPEIGGYAGHTRWSDPGPFVLALKILPREPGTIATAVEKFMVHRETAEFLGWDLPADAAGDANLRRLGSLLATAFRRDSAPLDRERPPRAHLYCTCRDFALIAAATLRESGRAARLRFGYAGYFVPARWEDHRVCEYWTGERWAILDAELGPRARRHFGVEFGSQDVPPQAWRSAAALWRVIRSREIDAASCGVSIAGLAGGWFVAAAVLRDAAALVGIEALPWDYWGPGRKFCARRTEWTHT